jgi:histidyl-tRNA synthetase
MLRRADATGASLCVVMGDSELERGVVQLKNLAAHTQEELGLPDAARAIYERLKESHNGQSEGSP